MSKDLIIKGPRQRRAVQALLDSPHGITCKDLGHLIGALNPQQIISELRRQGFGGVIDTRRFKVSDRDGRACYPGEYYLRPEHRDAVKRALERQTAESQPHNSAVEVLILMKRNSDGGVHASGN